LEDSWNIKSKKRGRGEGVGGCGKDEREKEVAGKGDSMGKIEGR